MAIVYSTFDRYTHANRDASIHLSANVAIFLHSALRLARVALERGCCCNSSCTRGSLRRENTRAHTCPVTDLGSVISRITARSTSDLITMALVIGIMASSRRFRIICGHCSAPVTGYAGFTPALTFFINVPRHSFRAGRT